MQNCKMSVIFQSSAGNSNSSIQPSPDTQPLSPLHHPQPDNSIKSSSGPPIRALEAVKKIQAAAARQAMSHMAAVNGFGRGSPVVNPAVPNSRLMTRNQQMQAPIQKPMSQIMTGFPNHMLNIRNVTSWENSQYPQFQQPHQNTQLNLHQPSQIMEGPDSMVNSLEYSTMGSFHAVPSSDPSITDMQRSTQACQQLLQILESPVSAQQQQQVLAILKANPQLMVDFIKHRITQQQLLSNISPSIAGMERHTQAWQQLFQTLNMPASVQQQQHVLAILLANPEIMAAFIKDRIAQQQQLLLHQQQEQMMFDEGNMMTHSAQNVWYK